MASANTPQSDSATRALTMHGDRLAFRKFKVAVMAGRDAGREETSSSDTFGIGSADGNDLVLTDDSVSRHHCEITATPKGYILRDLDSTNGTIVGGHRVQGAYLRPGSVITLGHTTLRFESLPDEVHEDLSTDDRYGRALGRTPAMRRLFTLLPKVAASASTVLIEGETGTGKTVLAEAIHDASPRASEGRFVVVDCSAIPPTLIESALFGHEKGAFTGAHAARAGAFEAAQQGTIFLDEIGELPAEMQPKLLRALEARVITRVGSTNEIRLDVRVIAATNRDLREMVNRGTFRADLFYRLNIVRLRIPPLRERRDDIPLLVARFYEEFAAGPPDPEQLAILTATFLRLDWPGNVRELRNAVERAVLLGDPMLWEDAVEASAGATPEPVDPSVPFRVAKERVVAEWERTYLAELLRRNGNKLTHAARSAQMDRGHLRDLLRRHGIVPSDD